MKYKFKYLKDDMLPEFNELWDSHPEVMSAFALEAERRYRKYAIAVGGVGALISVGIMAGSFAYEVIKERRAKKKLESELSTEQV